MKTTRQETNAISNVMKNTTTRKSARILAGSIAALLAVQSAQADSGTWDGSADSLWATIANWSSDPNPVPGTGNTATFDNAGGALDTIDLGLGVTIGTILFDTASAAAYTIGSVSSQTLTLDNGGAVTMNSTVASDELFNSTVLLGTDATLQSYTFTNESTTNLLTFAGNISGGTGGVAGIKTLNVAGAGNTLIGGTLANGGATAVALTKSGAGTLTLSGSNTYTGVTTISAGRIAANSATALGVGGNITFTGGTLRYSSASAVQDWGARIKSSSSAIRLDLNGQNVTLAGVMDSSNTAGLSVTGPGRLVLSGANGFTGNITVSGATLSISGDGTGATNQLGAYPGGVTAANITLNNGATLEFTGAATLAVNRGITLGAGFQALSKPASISPVISGVITGSGGLILQDQRPHNVGGGSNLNLNAANTFTGITTLAHGDRGNQNGGRFSLGNANALQNSTVDYLNILGLNSKGATDTNAERILFPSATTYTIGGLKGDKGWILTDANQGLAITLRIGNNNQNTIYTGSLNTTQASNVRKIGSGVQQLGGVNAYGGATFVDAGTLLVTASGTALGTNKNLTVASGATFAYEPTAAGALTLGSGVLTITGGVGTTILGAVGGSTSQSAVTSSGAAVTSGAVTVNVTGIPGVTVPAGTTTNNLFTAGSGLAGATYTLGKIYNATNFTVGALGSSATAITLDVTQSTALTAEIWKGGNAGGGNSVWAQSDGSANSNWTTDGTTVTSLTPGTAADISFVSTNTPSNQGAMTLGANMNVKSVTISDSVAAWNLNEDGSLLTVTPASSATGITVTNTAGTVTFNTPMRLGASQTWTNASGTPLTFTNDVTNNANNLTIDGAGNTTISGSIRNGTGSLTKNGAGTLLLSGYNLLQGGITVNAGTVQAGHTFALGAAMYSGAGGTFVGNGFANLTFGAGSTGTVQLNGNNITLTRLSTNATPGTPVVENASGTPVLLTVTESTNTIGNGANGAAATDTYAGTLRDGTGGGALSLQTTVGSLTLTGTVSYTGQTLIQGGTLIFGKRQTNYANWTPANVNVASGATIGLGVGDNAGGYFDVADLDTLFNASHLGASTTTSGLKTGSILGFDTTNATAGTFTYNSNIPQLGGFVQLAKLGAGTLVLGGSSTYTGVTNVVGGTLAVSSLANGGSASPIGQSSNAASNLLLGNGTTFQYTGGAGSTDRVFTVNGTAAGHSASLDASGSGAINFTSTLPILWGTAAQTRTFNLTGTNTGDNTLTPLLTDNTSGVVTLNKTGAGTWVLNSAKAFTGTTTVNGGTLKLGVNNTLQLNKVLTVTSGTLDLGGNSQYAGNFTGAGGIVTGTGGTFTTNAANGTFAGQITGSLHFVKAGANTLLLAADNTTTGTTKVIGGALTLKDSGRLSGTTGITINNAALNIDNSGTSNLADRVNNVALAMNGGTLSFTGTSSAATETLGAVSVDSGFNTINVPVAAAASTLTLTSLSRAAGALINVQAGSATSLGQGGTNPALLVTGDLAGMSANLQPINSVVPGAYNFQNSDNSALVNYVAGVGFGLLGQPGFGAAPAAGSSASGSTDNVTGGWALTGDQTVNSLTAAGTFTFAGSSTKLTIGTGMIVNNSQQGSVFGTTALRGQLTSGTGELFIVRFNGNGTPSNQVFNSQITGGGVKLIIAGNSVGDGRYDPVLTAQNDYTGGTVVSGVRVKLIGTNVGDVVIPNGGVAINDGATLAAIVNAGQIHSGNTITINGGGTLQLSGTNTLAGLVFNSNGGTTTPTVSAFSSVTGASGVAIGTSGTGTLRITGDISSTPTNVAVTPVIGPASSLLDLVNTSKNITVSANPGYAAQTGLNIQSNIQSGTSVSPGVTPTLGNINKLGTGVLQLSGANTFAGGLNISAGAVLASNASALGGGPSAGGTTITSTVAMSNNAGLWMGASTGTAWTPISVAATSATLASTGGDFTFTAPIAIAGGGTLTVSLADPALNSTDRAVTINQVISGAGSLVVGGAAGNTVSLKNLVLSVPNTFTGGTTINSGGRLQTTANIVNSIGGGALTINNNGVLDVNASGNGFRVGALNGQSGGVITNSSGTAALLVLGHGDATGGNFPGIINGTNTTNVIKYGSGTQTLSGNNTYVGSTTVYGGTLTLSGSPTGNSAVTVNAPGTLTLDYGTNNTTKVNDLAALTLAGGTLNLSGGSHAEVVASTTLSPGASSVTRSSHAATLNFGAITRQAGSTLDVAASDLVLTSTGSASTLLTAGAGAYATVGGTDWAAKNAGNTAIVGFSTVGSYSPTTASALGGGGNQSDVAAGIDTTLAAGDSTSTLRFNQNEARTITIGGGQSLTLTQGGLLVTSAVNPGSGTSTITGGTLKAGSNNSLQIIQNSPKGLTIDSIIANGSGTSDLVKSGTGALTLTKANTYSGGTYINGGTVTLGSIATISSGLLTVNGATASLDMGANRAISVGAVTLDAGGSITGTGTSTLTGSSFALRSGSISAILNSGAVTKTTNGTVTLTGNTTTGGGLTVSAGNLVITGATAQYKTLSGGANINDGSSVTVSSGGAFNTGQSAGDLNIGNNTSGASVTVTGAGSSLTQGTNLRVGTGANAMSNSLTISNGAVANAFIFYIAQGNNLATPTANTVTITGAGSTLTVSNVFEPFDSGSGGLLSVLNGGTLNTLHGTNYMGYYGNSKNNAVVVDGAGSVWNMGTWTNLWSGSGATSGNAITVSNGGTINFTVAATAGNSANAININSNGIFSTAGLALSSNTMYFNGGILKARGNSATFVTGGSIVLAGAGAVDTNTFNSTITSAMSGPGALTKISPGTLTLTAANIHTGGTNVNFGTLLVSGANNMPTTGTLAVGAGGNFSVADGTARTTTAAAVTLVNGSNLGFDWNAGATDTLTSTAAATTTGNVGIIINPTNAPSGGPLTLLSSSLGGLQTAGSTKYFLANNTNFTATLSPSDTAVTIGGYATATALTNAYWLGGQVTDALGSMNLSSGTTSNWASDAAGTLAGGVVPGGAGVNVFFSTTTGAAQQGAVKLDADTVLNTVTFTDSTAVTISGSHYLTLMSTGTGGAGSNAIFVDAASAATTTFNANLVLGASQTWSVAAARTLAVGGVIAGAGANSLTVSGSGTVILSGANTYAGSTTVSGNSVLNIQSATALGTTAAGTSVAAGSALQLQGGAGITVGAEALTLNGSGISSDGALRNISGANVWQGTVTLASAARINSDAGSLTLDTAANSITGTNQNLSLGGAANGTVGGTITIGSGTLTKDGAGTWTISGANTYTGLTTVNLGTLQLGIANAIKSGNSVTVNSTTAAATATLDLNGFGQTIGTPTTLGLTFGGAGATNSSTSQVIGTGAGSILTLAGTTVAVTYDATNDPLGASITATTVSLNNAAQTFTIGDSASVTVGGNELTVTSAVTSGGASGALVKEGTGALRLDGAQGYNTLTANDGTLNINGTLGTGTSVVTVTDTVGGAATKLRFGTVSQTLSSLTIGAGATVVFTSGTASGSLTGDDGGGKAAGFGSPVSSFGGGATVPEPGTIGLLLVGALGMMARRRRQA